MKRMIVAGSRTAEKYQVFDAIQQCPYRDKIDLVVSGCALGADTHGMTWARMRNLHIRRMPADWKTHGRSAGMIRNREMAENADGLIAVWDGKSRGTKNMIEVAKRFKLPVFVMNLQMGNTLIHHRGSETNEDFWRKK